MNMRIKKIACQYCNKEFSTPFNCKRHEGMCLHRPGPSNHTAPQQSQATTTQPHNKTTEACVIVPQQTKKKAECYVNGCSAQFFHRRTLIKHIQIHHPEIKLKDPINLEFKSFEEFKSWKEKEEEATYSYFYQKRGQLNQHVKYFYCQHDGSDKPHSTRKTSRRRSLPSIKNNRCCIAQMKVWKGEDERVYLEYLPTHAHKLDKEDIRFHPASSGTLRFIDEQISAGESPSKIYHDLQVKDVSCEKINSISLRQIRNRARRFRNSSERLVYKPYKGKVKIDQDIEIDEASNFSNLQFYYLEEDEQSEKELPLTETTNHNYKIEKALEGMEKGIDKLKEFVATARNKETNVPDELIFHSQAVIRKLLLKQSIFLKTCTANKQRTCSRARTVRSDSEMHEQSSQYAIFIA